jgi:hypothetical protein
MSRKLPSGRQVKKCILNQILQIFLWHAPASQPDLPRGSMRFQSFTCRYIEGGHKIPDGTCCKQWDYEIIYKRRGGVARHLRCHDHRVNRVATAAFWRTFSHEGKISLAGEGGGCTPTPFYDIYHHQESCSVRSSWVGRHTNPVSSLGKYVLCGHDREEEGRREERR